MNIRIDRQNIKLCMNCGVLVLTESSYEKECPECNFKSLHKIEINLPEKRETGWQKIKSQKEK